MGRLVKQGSGHPYFGDLLKRELILADLSFRSAEAVLRHMGEQLVSLGYCRKGFVEAILEREAHHPSGLPMEGRKIAIPHTDAKYVNKSAILFARLRTPVTFRSMGNPSQLLQVEMVSMFALKEKQRIGDLLEVLLTVYQDSFLLDLLYAASSPDEIYRILKRHVEETTGR